MSTRLREGGYRAALRGDDCTCPHNDQKLCVEWEVGWREGRLAVNMIQSAAQHVWDEVGGDYVTMCRRERIHDIVPKSEVVEVVLDGGRLELMLSRKRQPAALAALYSMAESELTTIVTSAFQCDFYAE